MKKMQAKKHEAQALAAPLEPNAKLVFERDYDRFLLAMLAPPEARDGLFALYAFNYEIAKVLDTVSEPMLGEIRFEWWREAVEECVSGTPRRHATVTALAPYLRDGFIDPSLLNAMIDARSEDLTRIFEGRAPIDLNGLQEFARDTGGLLARAAGQCLLRSTSMLSEAAAERLEKAGTAYALVGLMRALPFHQRARRRYVPDAMLKSAGLSGLDYAEGRAQDTLAPIVDEICKRALSLLQPAGNGSASEEEPSKAMRVATFSAAAHGKLARIYTDQLRSFGWNPFDPRMERPPIGRGLRLVFSGFLNKVRL